VSAGHCGGFRLDDFRLPESNETHRLALGQVYDVAGVLNECVTGSIC
jgi:hypothetical protein